MKKTILIFAVVLAICNCLRAQEKRKTDSLVFTEIQSKVLQEKRRVVVHLPLNYTKETTKRYPVMYVLDAGRLDFDISDRLFTLSSAGIAPECIVVGILNTKNGREKDLTPPFMQLETDDASSPMGNADRFLDFFQSELIPMIDTSYRTTGYQTISGHSRAGLFVLYTLIEKPDLFDARFCYSTPAWRFDNIIIKRLEARLRRENIRKDTYLFLSIGDNENPNIVSGFHTLNTVLKNLKPRHLEWDSYSAPLADHQSNPVFSTSKALISWCGAIALQSKKR